MAHAHMAIGIHHVFAGEDAVGDDEVAHQGWNVGHGGPSGGGGGERPTPFSGIRAVELPGFADSKLR